MAPTLHLNPPWQAGLVLCPTRIHAPGRRNPHWTQPRPASVLRPWNVNAWLPELAGVRQELAAELLKALAVYHMTDELLTLPLSLRNTFTAESWLGLKP